MRRIAIVGVGLLGSAVASRLLEGGLTVAGHDTRPELLEALQARTPVVAFPCSDVVPELVRKSGGALAPMGDVEKLADAIVARLQSREPAADAGHVLASFALSTVADGYAAVVEKAIQRFQSRTRPVH